MREVIGADEASDDDCFTPPTMFARESLDWTTFEDTKIDQAELPAPTTWHVLIMPKQPKQMSKGGIALPTQAQDVEMHLNYIGQVVAIGPLCGQHEKFQDASGKPRWDVKLWDWVIYGRYAGLHIMFKGVKFLLVNDDDILNIIKSPDGFKVYT